MQTLAWGGAVLALIVAAAGGASAQAGGKPMTGNPTPGTEQPAPPDLSNRVTLSGCLQAAPTGGRTAGSDPNELTDSRFVLANATRVNRVPAGTGSAVPASRAISRTYRLQGIESQLGPFVGKKVEISGEIDPASSGANSASATLRVEFVQKTAATCR